MVKKVLITGAGTGFGRGVAFGLAANPDYQVIATTESYAQIFALEKEAKQLGLTSIVFDKLDVTKVNDRQKAADWQVDILFNNAGVSEGGSVLDIPQAALETQFETNVFGPIALTQIIGKQMVQRQSGRIVFMSSVAGLTVDPFAGAYSASKHAIEAFAEALYKETRPYNVDVLTINPGPFLTGFNDRMFETYRNWEASSDNVFDYRELNFPHEQYDPQLVIDAAIKIIQDENPHYRNVLPEEIQADQKEQLAAIWERQTKDGLGVKHELVKKAETIDKETAI